MMGDREAFTELGRLWIDRLPAASGSPLARTLART
ncbi:hypothetical protein BH23CHL8_BH23CHL8_21890 [soil metagenome]